MPESANIVFARKEKEADRERERERERDIERKRQRTTRERERMKERKSASIQSYWTFNTAYPILNTQCHKCRIRVFINDCSPLKAQC